MNKRFFTMAAATVFLSASAMAQSAAPKIGVINMQGALMQTKDGQKASNELKAKFSPKQDEFQKRQQALQAKQEQYRRTEATMSAEAKANMERDIQDMGRTLQRDTDDTQQDFQAEENRLLSPIMNKMQQILTKYAIDNQLSMIIDASTQPNNLLYADEASNITPAIVALYDKAEQIAPAPAAPTAAAPKPAAPAAPKPPAAAPPKPKN